MANMITSDNFLSEEQARSLPALLNCIIPRDDDRGMPGAGELDFVGYVNEFAPEAIEGIRAELDELNMAASDEAGAVFGDLSEADQATVIEKLRHRNVRFGQAIVVQTMACYYQDDLVTAALGEQSPPFPEGNTVHPGDLSLLEPVKAGPRRYREA